MNDLPQQSSLLSLILTSDDREMLFNEIELLKNSLYGKSQDAFTNTLKNEVRQKISEIIIKEIQDKNPSDYLDQIVKLIENIEEVKLEIAYEASSGSIARLHEYLRKLTGQNVIIDLSINKYILGGTVIIYRGKYLDLSMRKIFDTEIKEARESLLKILAGGINQNSKS